MRRKRQRVDAEIARLQRTAINPTAANNAVLAQHSSAQLASPKSLATLLSRPELRYGVVGDLQAAGADVGCEPLPAEVIEQVEIAIKYRGYIERQEGDVARFRRLEETRLPGDIDYAGLTMLSKEVREKLAAICPQTLGQASRISGVTPAAISILLVLVAQRDNGKESGKGESQLQQGMGRKSCNSVGVEERDRLPA